MLGVTLFGIFLTPVFYYVIQWFADRRALAAAVPEGPKAGVLDVVGAWSGDHAPTGEEVSDGYVRKAEAAEDPLHEAEAALKALRGAHGEAERRRVLDRLTRATSKLNEQLH
jgi:hypothetical protein